MGNEWGICSWVAHSTTATGAPLPASVWPRGFGRDLSVTAAGLPACSLQDKGASALLVHVASPCRDVPVLSLSLCLKWNLLVQERKAYCHCLLLCFLFFLWHNQLFVAHACSLQSLRCFIVFAWIFWWRNTLAYKQSQMIQSLVNLKQKWQGKKDPCLHCIVFRAQF